MNHGQRGVRHLHGRVVVDGVVFFINVEIRGAARDDGGEKRRRFVFLAIAVLAVASARLRARRFNPRQINHVVVRGGGTGGGFPGGFPAGFPRRRTRAAFIVEKRGECIRRRE